MDKCAICEHEGKYYNIISVKKVRRSQSSNKFTASKICNITIKCWSTNAHIIKNYLFPSTIYFLKCFLHNKYGSLHKHGLLGVHFDTGIVRWMFWSLLAYYCESTNVEVKSLKINNSTSIKSKLYIFFHPVIKKFQHLPIWFHQSLCFCFIIKSTREDLEFSESCNIPVLLT